MRFIGSKVLLLDEIKKIIDDNIKDTNAGIFCDLFSGTGTVGRFFKDKYTIISNDIMYFSYVLQKATIEGNNVPNFERLKKIGINDPIGYLEEIDISNINFQDSKYFISNNYAPNKNSKRMYFTYENANRIDFIRLTIESWKERNLITLEEYFYLLASLIEAVSAISNTSGTYGAYLKKWDNRALKKLNMVRFDVLGNGRKNRAYNKDANKLIRKINGDILYLDPPYNNRQYSSNYHLLETIALYDYPKIIGVTGIRQENSKKSKYCHKSNVHNVFADLIKNAQFKHIIISYSTDGLMTKNEIEKILKKYCNPETYKVYKIPYRKYKSKHRQKSVKLYELIFYAEKDIKLRKNNTKNIKIKISKYKKKPKKNIKSPLNYIGGKYKILDQLLPLFPANIATFVDLFAGGLNVGINIDANKIIANDYNNFIIELYKEFLKHDIHYIINHIEGRIKQFQLSKTNEEGFLKFREFYNKYQNPLDLYTLACYSFNYQIRFNNNHEYNNPFGRNRSRFSDSLKNRLILFVKELKKKPIELLCNDFRFVTELNLDENDFVYCDPPYLITTGSYNDGRRGFKGWNKEEEKALLNILDYLDENNIKFALSNVLKHKGKVNTILKKWSTKYNVLRLNNDYSNSSYNTRRGKSDEVLIINYDL